MSFWKKRKAVQPKDPKELSKLIVSKGLEQFIIYPPLPKEYFESKEKFNNSVSVRCPFCDNKSYSTIAGLKCHLQGVCRSLNQIYKCKVCQENFSNPKDVKSHLHGTISCYID